MAFEDLILGLVFGGTIGTIIAVAGLFWWRFWQNLRWPIRIPMIRQRGENLLWELEERARYAKNKAGYEVIKLKKDKENIRPPKFNQVHLTAKGKSVMPLFNPARGSYFPVKSVSGPALETVQDPSAKNWGILEHQRLNEAYKPNEGFWEKYAIPIVVGSLSMMILFFVIYMSSTFQAMVGTLGGAISQSNSANSLLATAIAKAYGLNLNTTGPATIIP
jgi:hypothetical protein